MARLLVITSVLMALLAAGCSEREDGVEDPNATTSVPGASHSVSGARYAARLVCYLDEIGSGSYCSAIVYDPNNPPSANVVITTRSLTCGWPGKASEISWRFVRHKGAKDIYNFERRFPADGLNPQVTSQTVAFDGAQVLVFEDEHQVIVLDTPQ